MNTAAMAAAACRIPRRRHRSIRTAAQRRFARTAGRYCGRPARLNRLGRGRRGPHQRVHHDRRDRRRPEMRGLSGPYRVRGRSCHAADKACCDARRQSRPAFALLVLSQSANRLPQEGRTDCPARKGNHLYGVAFDLGPCVAPHPSTMAAALLAYDAKITTDLRSRLTIGKVFGDGSNGGADHALVSGEIIESVELASPFQRACALRRAISRSYAEWPLVEVVVRAVVADGRSSSSASPPAALRRSRFVWPPKPCRRVPRPTPRPLPMRWRRPRGRRPLPMTGYKLDLLRGARSGPARKDRHLAVGGSSRNQLEECDLLRTHVHLLQVFTRP